MKANNGDLEMTRLFLVGLLLSAAEIMPAQAQATAEGSEQIWIDVNPAYFVHSDLKLYGDLGVRWDIGDDGWWRLVARPSFRTNLAGSFFFSAGIGNFYTFNKVISDRWELRPFQGLDFNWPRGKVPLRHYLRLEERYDFNTDTWDARTSLRGRYKLSASYGFAARRPDRFWQATAAVELFTTLTGEQGQMQEQSRLILGLDRSLARDVHYRFEFTWQIDGVFYDPDESVSNLYFRFRFTKKWGESQSLRKETSP